MLPLVQVVGWVLLVLATGCVGIGVDDETLNAIRQGRVHQFDFVTWSHTQIHPGTADQPSPFDSAAAAIRHRKRSNTRQQQSSFTIQQQSASQSTPEAHHSFLLQLDAYNKTFCFHLHPNYDLLHPDAHSVSHDGDNNDDDPTQPRREPLTAKAYRGYLMSVRDHLLSDDVNGYECAWTTEQPVFENYGPADTLGWARFVLGDQLYERGQPLHEPNSVHNEQSAHTVEFQGAFMFGTELYTVRKIRQYSATRQVHDIPVPDSDDRHPMHRTAQLMVFRRSDIRRDRAGDDAGGNIYNNGTRSRLVRRHLESNHFCGHDHLEWNTDQVGGASAYLAAKRRGLSYSRDYVRQLYRDTSLVGTYISLKKRAVYSGCPLSKRVLYMGVVMSCTYIKAYGGSVADARQQVIDNWNIASKVYEESFNIYLGLLTVVDMANCGDVAFNADCSTAYTISKRLSDFSKWRGDNQGESAGLWHLMSTCSTGATIGIAWLNMLCQTSTFEQKNSDGSTDYVSGTGVSTVVTYEWMVIAHEIGHNFGSGHDCTAALCVGCSSNPCASCCPCQDQCDCKSAYLMNPANNVSPNTPGFSSCSQTDICTKNQLFGTCLETPGSRIALNGGICGNGLREGDEQCDSAGIDDACCWKNCTLKATAQCSDENDGCCQDCKVVSASANRICRPAEGECDIAEKCAGNATCPVDVFQPDGKLCGNDTLLNTKCASGICTSRNAQCLAYGKGDVTGDCTSFSGQCGMFCNTPFAGCIKVSGSFRNGTPCGDEGYCYGGKCSNPDTLGAFVEWIVNNKNIAIVLFIVGGVIIFAAVSKCMSKPKIERRTQLATQIQFEESEVRRIKNIEAQRQKRRQMEKEAQDKRSAHDGQRGRTGTVGKSANIAAQMKQQNPAESSPGRSRSTTDQQKRHSAHSAQRPHSTANVSSSKQHGKSYDPRSPISEADEEVAF